MEDDVFSEVQVVEGISTTYAEYTVLLSTYTGNGRNIAIKCGSSSSYLYYYIDDIVVEEIPSCFIPTGFANTSVDVNTATFIWQAGNNETAWNIQYKKATDNDWSNPIAVDETTYTLTGLQRATTYEARVQANCAEDDQSDWTNPVSFTTECGIWTIDAQNAFTEDFENVDASNFPPTCWQKFSYDMSGYNYWYLNSNNGLGSSAAFSYWSEGYAFLVMPQMHIDGNAVLSFDYLIGSGTYNESCAVVVSTGEMTYNDFNQTVWSATGSNSGNASATVSLATFSGQDIYVAFKFKGSGTSGCTWYVDNVKVFVPVNQLVELSQGWNWFAPTVDITLETLEEALGSTGIIIKSQNGNFARYDDEDEEWIGNLQTIVPGQMYMIQAANDYNFTLNGIAISNISISIEFGSNWFGFIGTQTLTIEQALNGFSPAEGDRIKSSDGRSSVYEDEEWSGNLNQLVPGHGYVYISQDENPKQISFPANR